MAPGRGIAILAGGGAFPGRVARHLMERGERVLVIGIEGEADPDLTALPYASVRRGQVGRLIRLMRENALQDLVFLGSIRERRLPRVSEIDLAGVWHVLRNLTLLSGGDDSALRRIARVFAGLGLTIRGVGEVAPAFLAPAGVWGAVQPTMEDHVDLAVAFKAAKELGRADRGQGAVARAGAVIATEARTGTDAMLRAVPNGQRGVLVKCLKPIQDPRLDLPALGPDTLVNAAAAGLAGVAVEAGGAIVLDREAVIATADRLGLFVAGLGRDGRLDPT